MSTAPDAPPLCRRLAIENTLTFAVLQSLGGQVGALHGDVARGRVIWRDESGNHAIVAWHSDGVVALGYDHEGGADDAAEQFGLPPPDELDDLVQEVCEFEDGQATCALWATDTASSVKKLPISANALTNRNDLGVQALDRILGAEGAGADGLARRLADKRMTGPYTLSADDADEILRAKPRLAEPRTARLLDEPQVGLIARGLAGIGIRWEAPEQRVREINELLEAARRARAEGRPEPDARLLAAAASGDLDGVRGALNSGADVDCSSVPGELGFGCAGTALQIAVFFKHDVVATLLLERGANPAGNGAGDTPLLMVAQRGNVELCRALVARGAPLTWAAGEPILNMFMPAQKEVPILRLLVEAGAEAPSHPRKVAHLIKVAASAGETDLVERMKTWASK